MRRHRAAQALMIGTGLVHLVPATAVASRERLESVYGVSVPDADLELLLRHRALWFGLTGVVLVVGAVLPRHRVGALTIGIASVAGWLVLAPSSPTTNPALHRVTRVDLVLAVALVLAAWLGRGQLNAATMPAR